MTRVVSALLAGFTWAASVDVHSSTQDSAYFSTEESLAAISRRLARLSSTDPLGLVCLCGSIFGWGTALVFVKLERVKTRGIPPYVMTLYLSIGYLLCDMVALLVLLNSGTPVEPNFSGVLGGISWGIAKVLAIFAVSGAIGLATGSALQCCVTVSVIFLVGVLTGERVWWLQCAGVAVLIAGLGICTFAKGQQTAGSPKDQQLLEDAGQELGSSHRSVSTLSPSVADVARSAALACLSGVFFGVQTLPKQLWEVDTWSFIVFQGLGQFLVVACTCGVATLRGALRGDITMAPAVGVPAGFAGGSLLFMAASCNVQVVADPDLGMVASTLGQLNMIVAGLWGLLLFREIVGARPIGLFVLGVAVALLGAVMVQQKPGSNS